MHKTPQILRVDRRKLRIGDTERQDGGVIAGGAADRAADRQQDG